MEMSCVVNSFILLANFLPVVTRGFIMKQGLRPASALAAQVMARAGASNSSDHESLASFVSCTTNACTGAAMADQFEEHIGRALLGQETGAQAEVCSFSDIVEKVGRDPTQAILLSMRVRFTGLVEQALLGALWPLCRRTFAGRGPK